MATGAVGACAQSPQQGQLKLNNLANAKLTSNDTNSQSLYSRTQQYAAFRYIRYIERLRTSLVRQRSHSSRIIIRISRHDIGMADMNILGY